MHISKNLSLLLSSLGLVLLAACSPQPTPPENIDVQPTATPTVEPTNRGSGGTLNMLYWDAPTILNPHLTSGSKDNEVSRISYEPLATFDKEGQLVPILAAEIPTIDNGGLATDGKSVIWKLKEGVLWSDGEPFTADDVRFTFDFVTNPEVNAVTAFIYQPIAAVTVVDNHTVRIDFKEATPSWSLPFVGKWGVILPQHKFEAYNGPNAREAPANLEPVGTGPYRVLPPGIKPQEILFLGTKLVNTVKIVFEANPFFREEDKPYFSQIELRGGGTPSEAARLALETGEVDYTWKLSLSAEEIARLQNEGVGQIITTFGSTVDQIEPNFTDPNKVTADGERSSLQYPHPFFTDLKVRQAFAYAIDREKIVALYGSTGLPTEHVLVSPPQYKPDNTFYEFNLVKAAALLDEAGWVDTNGDNIRDKDGKKMSVLFQTYENPIRQETQKIIKKDLESIGVDVELKIVPISNFYGSGITTNPDHNGRFQADLQETDWTAVNPDPGLFLQYWTCDQIPQKSNSWSGNNFRRWCNPDYDTLYKQSQIELDPEKRRQIFIDMNNMLSEEVVTIPIVRLPRISGIAGNLEGFDPTPWDAETWNIKDWKLPDLSANN